MKILFCHDGSDNAQIALDKTISYFGLLRPQIILLSVLESQDASIESDEIYKREVAERKKILDKAGENLSKIEIQTEIILCAGDPRKMILKTAEIKKPDFIVVAKRGELSIMQKIFGSISEFLIRYSKIPVLVFQES